MGDWDNKTTINERGGEKKEERKREWKDKT